MARNIRLTIFTPTYNRGYIINQLYESLTQQSVKDFEWIIIDDGSTDDTQDIIKNIVVSNDSFNIIYKKQQNQGKHVAINNGVKIANGELFFIVDSDDILTENAVERILYWRRDLPEGYSGLGLLRADITSKKIFGKTFHGEIRDATSLDRNKYNIIGDKAEIYFTNILKKYPFPVFEGENFLTEAVVWNRIANAGFKMRWINEIIYLGEYLSDGLTSSIDKRLINNFDGYTLYVKELISYPKCDIKNRIKAIGMYAMRGRGKRLSLKEISSKINCTYAQILIPYIFARILRRK